MSTIKEALENFARVLGDADRIKASQGLQAEREAVIAAAKLREEVTQRNVKMLKEAEENRKARELIDAVLLRPAVNDLLDFLVQHRIPTAEPWKLVSARGFHRYAIASYSGGRFDEDREYEGTSHYARPYHGYLLYREAKFPKDMISKGHDKYLLIPQDPSYPDSSKVSHGWGSKYHQLFVGIFTDVPLGFGGDRPPNVDRAWLDSGLSVTPIHLRIGTGNDQLSPDPALFGDFDHFDIRAGFRSGFVNLKGISSSEEALTVASDREGEAFKAARALFEDRLVAFTTTHLPDFPRI